MKVKVAEYAGFCFGVKRAIKLAFEVTEREKNIFILGELIHNPQVVKQLKEEGVKTVAAIEDIKEDSGVFLIRSHGAPSEVFEKLNRKNLEVVDTTCPFVKKVHEYASGLIQESYDLVVIGDKEHPEVKSLISSLKITPKVISDFSEVKDYKFGNKIGVVVQTTQSFQNYSNIILELLKKNKQLKIFNTICQATELRQKATIKLSKVSDCMIVIGGRNSANTNRLVELSKMQQPNTYHIEHPDEIKTNWFINKKNIGLSAGASTPLEMIELTKNKIINFTSGGK